MDFANNPGQLFVVATLLPLASFLFLVLCAALRVAVRYAPEGSAGAALYRLLGGDTPARWPALVATGAIGLACVCCVTGAVIYLGGYSSMEKELHRLEHELHVLNEKIHDAEDEKDGKKLKQQIDDKEREVHAIEGRWKGHLEFIRIAPSTSKDLERGTVLPIGYRIDSLSVVMFVMVTFIATLIHIFSMGYMNEETERTVEDHHVHDEDGHFKRRGRFGRFFLYLSLFCFSMLNLILADNLFQVFLSWELVGICSYLLIGFYYERQSASNAANKAFITNRVGDAGFIIGLLIVWTYIGSFNFETIFRQLRAPAADSHGEKIANPGQFTRANPKPTEDGQTPRQMRELTLDPNGSEVVIWPRDMGHFHSPGDSVLVVAEPKPRQFGSMPYWLLIAAGLGIFLGCVGKSAQFPLQVWLPDAMEGPTPVSALIHAATMVAAGVYLVGRCFPLFTAEALLVIAYTGAITLFVAASIAVVMTDIKKVLAYSTVSQLGYMMLALGIGGWVAGLFHLVTHAFFKALLFLGSGSVIYGCHHEQEMTKMGGLYPKMKITALTMLMGVLAIAGIPAFSGWYSKDAIVAQGMGFATAHPQHVLLFVLPLLTAGLTTFYMFRMWLMTFTGEPRDHHVYEHAHESPRKMTTPLILLAVFSVCVGWGWPFFSSHFPFVNAESSALEHTLHHAQPQAVTADFGFNRHELEHRAQPLSAEAEEANKQTVRYRAGELHETAGNLALLMVGIGMVFAFALYYYRILDPAEAQAQLPGCHSFLQHKWYFDELYSAMLVRPTLVLGQAAKNIDLKGIDWFIDNSARCTIWLARSYGKFDNRVIDGLVNLSATVFDGIGGWFRRWQTGYLRSYVLFLVMAAVGLYVLLAYLMTAAV